MLSDATILRNVPVSQLDATDPDFWRIPNLFEIVSFDYWHANYGLDADYALIDAYLGDAAGHQRVQQVVEAKTKQRLEGKELAFAARGFSPAAMM